MAARSPASPASAVQALEATRSINDPDSISIQRTNDFKWLHSRGLFIDYLEPEALDKITTLADLRSQIEWHLIGPLQSNKTRPVAAAFDWVHSVDRLKIAQRLSEQRPAHLPPLQLCLQVNISGEASKSGLGVDEVPDVARAVAALPGVRLRGLMAIPAPAADVAAQREPHARLRALLTQLQRQGLALDTLSMGMTGDLEAAIAEGSTLVRVGTAIFGAR